MINVTFSCIIPACDQPELLKMTLESINSQSHKVDEIIVVDNGKKPLENTLPKDIKYFRTIPYMGVAQARNFGALMASSDFLVFLDHDDLWSEAYIASIHDEIVKNQSKFIISRLDRLRDGLISTFKNASGLLSLENLFTFNPGVTGSNIAICKQLFFTLGGYKPILTPSEDKAIVIEALLKFIKVTTLENNQAIIRDTDDPSRITSNVGNRVRGVLQLLMYYWNDMPPKCRFKNIYKIFWLLFR